MARVTDGVRLAPEVIGGLYQTQDVGTLIGDHLRLLILQTYHPRVMAMRVTITAEAVRNVAPGSAITGGPPCLRHTLGTHPLRRSFHSLGTWWRIPHAQE